MTNDYLELADALAFALFGVTTAEHPQVVCSGWPVGNEHPVIVLKAGDPSAVSHGMCAECEARMKQEAA